MHFAVSSNPGKAWNRSLSLPGPCTRDGTPERYFVDAAVEVRKTSTLKGKLAKDPEWR
jgi:hypothetical protein